MAEVHLDVREDIRQGREPLQRIMAAVDGLGPDDVLVVRAPFEPLPLYRVMARRGFAHRSERRASDDWSVWFSRAPAGDAQGREPAGSVSPGRAPTATIELDVRGLEPPLPMVRVLELLETLAVGQQLEVVHDRRPVFLYPQLDERGFLHETVEPESGVVRIRIRRGPDAT